MSFKNLQDRRFLKLFCYFPSFFNKERNVTRDILDTSDAFIEIPLQLHSFVFVGLVLCLPLEDSLLLSGVLMLPPMVLLGKQVARLVGSCMFSESILVTAVMQRLGQFLWMCSSLCLLGLWVRALFVGQNIS